MHQPITPLFIVVASIAFSITASADEFYIVRDQGSGDCRVVQNRPADMGLVVLNDTAYTTEENALGVIRNVCARH